MSGECLSNVASGIWKFVNVTEVELAVLAAKWKKDDPDGWLELHIRPTGKKGRQLGVGFKYKFKEKRHDKFFYRISDQLKREFGNNFVGWDIGSPTTVIC